MEYLYDYHIHSTYSGDGRNSMQDICKSAIEKGLKEIAITDHCEPIEGDEEAKRYKAKEYFLELEKMKSHFEGKLVIRAGVEIGQPHLFLSTAENLVKNYSYDYVIGSIHKLTGGIDLGCIDYNEIALEDICETCLKEAKDMVNKADFDCVGHLDVVKRYSIAHYKRRITFLDQDELLREVLKLIIAKGKGIEINSSGLRQDPKESMPGMDVLKLYRELRGEILTIGSDAHRAVDVAEGLREVREGAKECGFRYLTIFDKRIPQWIRV